MDVYVCLCVAGECDGVTMTCTEAEGGRGALTHTRWCDCLCSLVCASACVQVSMHVLLCTCVSVCWVVLMLFW